MEMRNTKGKWNWPGNIQCTVHRNHKRERWTKGSVWEGSSQTEIDCAGIDRLDYPCFSFQSNSKDLTMSPMSPMTKEAVCNLSIRLTKCNNS